jgi:hypothetical protein
LSDATRKLATIVALDVAGYSARTEADEAKTAAEVAARRMKADPDFDAVRDHPGYVAFGAELEAKLKSEEG